MGVPKVNIQEVLLRLDRLDGITDRNYYGIPLSDGATTLGLCSQAGPRGPSASIYNPDGVLVQIDCKALAAKLNELAGVAEANPATALFSRGEMAAAQMPVSDEDIRLYALVDGWLKALLSGTKTAAEIGVEKLASSDAATVFIGWENLP